MIFSMQSTLRTFFIFLICFIFISFAYAEETAEPAKISYVELKPSIVSNLTGGPKYIRCDIQLMTEHAAEVPDIKLHMPAIRHAILMLIAGEDGNLLKSHKGKEALRKKALKAVQETLKGLAGNEMVKDLYFTAYYVR